MLARITQKWTFIRILYTLLGLYILITAVIDKQWLGIMIGAYFASMGIFAFGCAAGNCFTTPHNETNKMKDEVHYEEIK